MCGLAPSSESGIVGRTSAESRVSWSASPGRGWRDRQDDPLHHDGESTHELRCLDFETANEYPGGACSVGLARFDEETLLDTYYSLIRPKEPYFDPSMSAVHQLDSNECLAADQFDTIWPAMVRFIGATSWWPTTPLSTSGCSRGARVYDLQCDGLSYLCTLIIARKIWPKLLSYKLSYIVDSLELGTAVTTPSMTPSCAAKSFQALSGVILMISLSLRSSSLHPGHRGEDYRSAEKRRRLVPIRERGGRPEPDERIANKAA